MSIRQLKQKYQPPRSPSNACKPTNVLENRPGFVENDVEIPTTPEWSYGRLNTMALSTNHADSDGPILALRIRLNNSERNVNMGNSESNTCALGHTA